jgi:hypothetical protein
MSWLFYNAPVVFGLVSSSPVLLVIVAAVSWFLVVQNITRRVVAARKANGAFLPRLVAWLRVPLVERRTPAYSVAERVQVLDRIAADRAQLITLPTADRDAA